MKKRIGFFIHAFSGGGAERVTILLANELANQGYDVEMICRSNTGELLGLINNKIKIINLGIQVNGGNKLIKNIKNIIQLRKIYTYGYDTFFAVTTSMSLVAAISNMCSRKRVPLVPIIHNAISQEQRTLSKLRNFLISITDKYVYKTVVVSKEAAADYTRTCNIPEKKVLTIYNPVISLEIEEKKNETVSHPWLIENRKWRTLVTAGRLSYQKNHDLLLNAFKLVSEKEDLRLIILGVGERKEELKDLADQLGISDKVDFYGFTKNALAFFKESDLFVLSSHFEGLPTVLIEAMYCGCNIVSVDCPTGPKEILQDGEFGILCECNDTKKLAVAIQEGLNRKKNTEDLVKQALNYTVDKATNEYARLIEEIAG